MCDGNNVQLVAYERNYDILIDTLDRIHSFYYHSYDIFLRLKLATEEDNNFDDHENAENIQLNKLVYQKMNNIVKKI